MEKTTFKGKMYYQGKEYEVKNILTDNGSENKLYVYDELDSSRKIACIAYNPIVHKNNISINFFIVNPEYQSKGLGTDVLKFFLDNITAITGIERIENVFVHPHNKEYQQRLEQFYLRFGFKLTKDDPLEYATGEKEYKRYDESYQTPLDAYIRKMSEDTSKNLEQFIYNKDDMTK